MHAAMHGSISPREADQMSFDELIEVHRTLDAVDIDMANEQIEREKEAQRG